MKIRTVTFFKENNSGAVLQAYALSHYLALLGNDVEILNYDPFWSGRIKDSNSLKDRVKAVLLYPHHKNVGRKYRLFRENFLSMTPIVRSVEDIEELSDCDVYIAGSDQIWNPYLLGCMDDIFFLNFTTNARKMSYAASYGRDDFSEEYLKKVAQLTSDYSSISVRENNFKTALNPLVGQDVECVSDPVFLLNAEEYRRIKKEPKLSGYLLIYTKSYTDDIWEYARYIARKRNLKIVDTSKIFKKKGVNFVRANIGPEDFLGLIDGADFVLTNSFHGTAFSIILEKNFYALSAGAANARIESLLEHLDLKDRQIIKGANFEISDIDYNKIAQQRLKYTGMARSFLEKSLLGLRDN